MSRHEPHAGGVPERRTRSRDVGAPSDHPYTRRVVDTAQIDADGRVNRFDGLHAEAKAVLGRSANDLRAVRDRYREAYREELARWQAGREELDAGSPELAARGDEEAAELGLHQSELSKLELTERSLENMWLFLERGDASLIGGPAEATFPGDVQMRIVEAQEAERGRLAQEVHDGPAQALSNAIFQVEYIERVLDQDVRMARTELRFLRDLLRRELGDVRTFITQLRPPVLDQLGLDGAVADTAATMTALSGLPIETLLEAPADRLAEAEQTVVLRVVQEALQNVRKHAAATRVTVTSRMAGADWILEVRDDGRGFDAGAVAARGRRNFGLQFMRERAALIGARLEVRSRPAGGTVVVLAVPTGEERG
jgi:two-component system, NarL family, sensor histidine kinase DegS